MRFFAFIGGLSIKELSLPVWESLLGHDVGFSTSFAQMSFPDGGVPR